MNVERKDEVQKEEQPEGDVREPERKMFTGASVDLTEIAVRFNRAHHRRYSIPAYPSCLALVLIVRDNIPVNVRILWSVSKTSVLACFSLALNVISAF